MSASSTEPTICDPNVQQHSGFLDVGNKNDPTNMYFYWLFESRNDPEKAPLLMWLTGGPGCSSLFGLFIENGPCKLINNGTSPTETIPNPYSWNSNANLLYVDQPSNVGFSVGPIVPTLTEISQYMYAFLLRFMKTFPQYLNSDNGFFIAGESYAGHYIPNIVNYIHKKNKETVNSEQIIPLAGFAIGNGDTDPLALLLSVPEMAFHSELTQFDDTFTTINYDEVVALVNNCSSLILLCRDTQNEDDCVRAHDCSDDLDDKVVRDEVNQHNMRLTGDYDTLTDLLMTWLNLTEVQESIGISPHMPFKWDESFDAYHDRLKRSGASVEDSAPLLREPLNDGIRGLIYAGDFDWVCSWMGNEAWTLDLEWEGQMSYNEGDTVVWEVNGEEFGEIRQDMNAKLTFVRVYDAGHLVPMDKPRVSLELINQFLSNTLTSSYWTESSQSRNMEMIGIGLNMFALFYPWIVGCVLVLWMVTLWIYCRMKSVSRTKVKEIYL